MPYLRHQKVRKNNNNNIRFVPFEDLMDMGTSNGLSSVVVPGNGVPYFDIYEKNPFETKKQKRESFLSTQTSIKSIKTGHLNDHN
jgi:U3 small nucleolar RNA-associated protein 7